MAQQLKALAAFSKDSYLYSVPRTLEKEMQNLGKRSETTGAGIKNRIQEIEEGISGI